MTVPRSVKGGALPDDRVSREEALEVRCAWYESRLRQLAAMFGVPDEGRYLADWRTRADELQRLREQQS